MLVKLRSLLFFETNKYCKQFKMLQQFFNFVNNSNLTDYIVYKLLFAVSNNLFVGGNLLKFLKTDKYCK